MIELIADRILWNWWSPVWLVVVVIAIAYGRIFGWKSAARTAWLTTGLAVLVFAFVSPLGVLADGFLFSAHMIQHLLLLLVVPLCLVLSLPMPESGAWPRFSATGGLRQRLSKPAFGWLLGLGAMWFWHVPAFCNAATESYGLGVLRSASFLLAGIVFWWPIYSPSKVSRLPAGNAVVYLFSACLGCTLLGIYITFTTITVCPAFVSPEQRLAMMIALNDAGMTSSVDQQLGGLLMWVPPCSLYILAILSVLCRWYSPENVPSAAVPAQTMVES